MQALRREPTEISAPAAGKATTARGRQRPQEEEQQDPKPRHVQTSRREPQADGTRQLVGYFPR